MSILKADILTFVNAKLNRAETDIDTEIQTVLNDLSDEYLLTSSDLSQSLAGGSTYLVYPTNFKEIIALVLSDSVQSYIPLKPQSYAEYLEAMTYNASTGKPEYYSEYDGKFYMYPAPNAADTAYTAKIEYYRYHPQDVATILFRDEFKNAINFGVTAEVAASKKLVDYISLWGQRYEIEKNKRSSNVPKRAYIVRD